MQAGKLRRRLTLLAPSPTKDDFGQPVDTAWQNVLDAWGEIATITGREIYALGSGFTSQITHRVSIRFPEVLVTAGMRVSYESRLFLVQAVSDPTEDKRQLDLLCMEVSK